LTIPITFKPSNYGEKRSMVNGMIFVHVEYTPRPESIFYPLWREQVYNIHPLTETYIDRFEHMNDFLSNEFTEQSQYGHLNIDLTKVDIPKNLKTAESDADGQENQVYMLRVKVRNEIKTIYVGAPDNIYGDHLESISLHAMVQSLRDLVYVEFYDVLEEENFDPKIKQPMSNLRLLAHKTFEVKDLPFNKDDFCEGYSLLMPIDYSKKVAEFKFNAQFTKAVSPDFISKPLESGTGYIMTSKLVFSKEFAINHDKSLDKATIFCQIQNMSNSSLPVIRQRVYFNKETFELGKNFIRVGN